MIREYQVITHLMVQGKYDEAYLTVNRLDDPVLSLIYHSRISELLGKFDHAKEYALLAIERMNNGEYKSDRNLVFAYIATAFACFRLKCEEEGLKFVAKCEKILERHYDIDNPDYISLVVDGDANTRELLALDATMLIIKGRLLWKSSWNCLKMKLVLDLFEKSRLIWELLEWDMERANAMDNIGHTYLHLMEFHLAEKYYFESFELREKSGSKPGIATSFNSLARYYDATGDFETAICYYVQAREMWRELGNKQFEAKALRNLGINAKYRKENNEAMLCYKKALANFMEIGNHVDVKKTQKMIRELQ